ncbi:hypothetical protein IMCC20628_02732 [Hoeflea sp. IMCC20628]|uniref:hypothetical protein n=1 Tax=Hoeflea sp. IMCC20628 TaxID=1620421 RepID=UPI00063AB89C|nr:hypothetical protein [Hoeflea sp. IMCC20628]AKI01428.1 hypothetical protein IMCC20628_02732 [Hoeflea sp. IMCC20628]
MRDIYSDFGIAATIAPAVQAATIKGTAVDTKGFGSAMLAINTGAIVGDGLYSVKLQESDTTTDGDFADVASADLLGELPAALAAATAYKQGYIGSKRYIRALITKASGTSIAAGAVVMLGHPNMAPVA